MPSFNLNFSSFAITQRTSSKKEYKEQAIPTLSLVARNKEVIVYLLNERGYSKEFMREIELLLKEATPPKPPKALKDFDS